METRQKQPAAAVKTGSRQQLQLCAIIALSLVFAIYLAVSVVQRNRITAGYAEARDQLASVAEQNINLFLRTCDSAALAGADVEHDLLPDLRAYYYAMTQLDDAMTYAFGSAYALLSDGTRAQIQATLDAYDEAFLMGRSTEEASAALADCAATLRGVLSERFTESGAIIAN